MPKKFSVSVVMRGSLKATPCMYILAHTEEGAWVQTQQIINTVWAASCRPEGAEFIASICDPDDFQITHKQNF